MTKPGKTTKPETLEIEQLDAAVGGDFGAFIPCIKAVEPDYSKIKPYSPSYPVTRY